MLGLLDLAVRADPSVYTLQQTPTFVFTKGTFGSFPGILLMWACW